MKKKSVTKILLSVMVLLVSVAFCACGSNKSTESSETGNSSSEKTTESAADGTQSDAANSDTSCFTVGLSQEISSLDPHEDTDAGTRSVLFNVFEGLVKPTTDGDVTPAVASDYTISDDAKTYTFTLRDGITFQDGNPVTVEDIKYSLERSAEMDGESSALSAISAINIVDDKTIELTLSEANSEFIYNLSVAILEQANDANQATNPIGTGPFKITNFAEGQYLEMERYDGYWNKELDCIQHAKFKFIADAQSAFVELQGGTIDMLQYLTNDQVAALGTENYNIVESTMMLVHGLFLNNAYEPLKDVRVRQALNYAVDRDAINEFLFGGKSKIIQTHGYPTITAWYNADTEGTYTYDVDKAKELLAEAGYADGFDLDFYCQTGQTYEEVATILQAQLADVGINLNVITMESNTINEKVYSGEEIPIRMGFYNNLCGDVDLVMQKLLPSAYGQVYFNDEVEELMNEARSKTDAAERQKVYDKFWDLMAEDVPWITIYYEETMIGRSNKVDGFKLNPVGAHQLKTVAVYE